MQNLEIFATNRFSGRKNFPKLSAFQAVINKLEYFNKEITANNY